MITTPGRSHAHNNARHNDVDRARTGDMYGSRCRQVAALGRGFSDRQARHRGGVGEEWSVRGVADAARSPSQRVRDGGGRCRWGSIEGMRFVVVDGAGVSAIGLGCWQFGSSDWGYGDDYARREAGAIVERALDLGVNLVDTAEIYAYGRSERIVGEAIRGRRDEVFLATQVFPVLPVAPVVEQRARGSARRLGVDFIDLYQVHWPNPVVPNGPTMEGMRRVVDAGLVRHVGVSNFSLARWEDAER